MNYIIVDFEMNPIAKEYKEERKVCGMEIIEIGAVVMDENFLVLGEFKSLIKPRYNEEIYKKYETLTGISTQMVSSAPDFATVYEIFSKWCESFGEEYEIHAWSDTDYDQLKKEIALKNYCDHSNLHKQEKWHDFQKEFVLKLGLERIISLEKALNYAAIDFEGQKHDALCDARNTAKLFAIVRNEERCEAVLKTVMEALRPKNVGSTLGEMFNFNLFVFQSA